MLTAMLHLHMSIFLTRPSPHRVCCRGLFELVEDVVSPALELSEHLLKVGVTPSRRVMVPHTCSPMCVHTKVWNTHQKYNAKERVECLSDKHRFSQAYLALVTVVVLIALN